MGLVEFIQDHRWWVLAICLPLLLIYGRVLFLAALGMGAPPAVPTAPPVRRIPSKPAQPSGPGGIVKPSGLTPPPEGRQEVLPNSLDAGLSGHQKAGAAKTVKLPATPSKPTDSPATRKPATEPAKPADSEAEAIDGLFGKRDQPMPPSESPSQMLRRKASRMEELGFHHGIAAELLNDPKSAPTPMVSAPAPSIAQVETSTSSPADTAIIPGGNAVPRSSTAELTSILERIDKFLAEDTPANPSPTLSDKPANSTLSKPEVAPAPALEAAAPASETSAQKATEAMPKVDQPKPDPNKKTQPMWARADAQDDDIDEVPRKDKKPGEGDQQRLF